MPEADQLRAGGASRLRLVAATLLLLPGLFGCATTGDAPAHDEAIATVRALERDWRDAFVRHDSEAMARLVADEFLITHSDGTVQDKADLLATIDRLRAAPDPRLRLLTREVQTRAHGNTVVVFGVVTREYTRGGEPAREVSRYTNTWVRRVDGRWQLVASHRSPIGER